MSETTVEVPIAAFEIMRLYTATAEAHVELCRTSAARPDPDQPSQPQTKPHRPNGGFVKVLSSLWLAELQADCVALCADYLAQMREHNPYAPKPGSRLTWSRLRDGLKHEFVDLDPATANALLAHLDSAVPDLVSDCDQP